MQLYLKEIVVDKHRFRHT